MNFNANQRIGQALLMLTPALTEHVARELTRHFGDGWRGYLSVARGGDREKPDAYALLKTMVDYWPQVFRPVMKPGDRTNLSIAFEARNATSHAAGAIEPMQAVIYLSGVQNLARAIGARAVADAIGTLLTEQMADVHAAQAEPAEPPIGAPAATAQVVPSSPARPKLGVRAPAARSLFPEDNGRLPGWRDVAPPHPDVLSPAITAFDFAADLASVVDGRAPPAYQDAREFFGGTYLTQGLKAVLQRALRRLAVQGGEPVIGLQTGFGGGKTHTMLALYHLANTPEARTLPGLEPLFAEMGLERLACGGRVYVFVGSADGTDLKVGETASGRRINTIWGALAHRLGGETAFAQIAEADAAWTNPGSRALAAILERAAPCLVLLDEVAAYARQLTGVRYEAFLTFIQSLTEAAKTVPGALVVGSLPESAIEVGGENGREVLAQLEKVFGRVGSPWAAAQGTEQFEIIRRRLFQPLDEDGERAREATIAGFQKYYKANAGEFPSEVGDAAFAARMRAAYPVHPELFRTFQEDWTNRSQFQRTRGVLKLMAEIIYRLWQRQHPAPLIMPGDVPLDDGKIRAEVMQVLDGAYAGVLDREVAGDQSRAVLLQGQVASFQRSMAPGRVATALFMATAPFGASQQGLPIARLRLACARPGDQPAVFGEALRRMQETSAYLYANGDRYWFSTQPTLNQLADDRARGFGAEQVDEEVRRCLEKEGRHVSMGWPLLHFGLLRPAEVEDDGQRVALVAFGPEVSHAPRATEPSLAMQLAADVVQRRGSGQRQYRNRLVFLAADTAGLDEVRRAVRKALAWASILADDEHLTMGQKKDAADRRDKADAAVQHAVRTTWKHLIWPSVPGDVHGPDAARGFALDTVALNNRTAESLARASWDRLRADAVVNEVLGPATLKLELDRLWPVDRPFVKLSELREWFFRLPGLARLRDVAVLNTAIAAATGIAPIYATARLAEDGATLTDVAIGRPAMLGDEQRVLLRINDAEAHLSALEPPASPFEAAATAISGPAGVAPPAAPEPAAPTAPRRFYATITLDPQRPVPLMNQVAQNILPELLASPTARVVIKIDIEAIDDRGFSADTVAVVSDNAKSLKLDSAQFEYE